VLAVLLMENGSLYARLAETNRELATRNDQLADASRLKTEYADALQDALAELEHANRDLRAFAGSLAHDLQQPITTISSFAQLLQKQAEAMSAPSARHLERILAAADWARRMIKALLEFSRLGQAALRREAVDLNAVVADARSAVSAGQGDRAIEWRIAPLPVVQGDPALLHLAFVNLLSNAVKYSSMREPAVICVEADEAQNDGHHVIRVRDNGVGFDMAHAARLFTPFERLHSAGEFAGTGMGLANVRRIIERHGGSVRAEAEPDRGATFTVLLR